MERCCCLVSVHPIGDCMNLEQQPEFPCASGVQGVGNFGPCRVPDTSCSPVHVFFVQPLLFIRQYCKQNTQPNTSLFKAQNNYRNEGAFASGAAEVFEQPNVSVAEFLWRNGLSGCCSCTCDVRQGGCCDN